MNKTYMLHSGVKGQRWGVRRYQNADGTLTAAGKARYGTGGTNPGQLEKEYGLKNAQAAKAGLTGTSKSLTTASDAIGGIGKNKSKSVNTKDYSKISDEEIRNRINRLNMERNYGELTGDTKRVRTGSDWTREVLQTTGAVVGIAGTIAGIVVAIKGIENIGSKAAKKVTK